MSTPNPQTVVIADGSHKPHWFVRILYFLFIGWWLGLLVSVLCLFLMITIIGLPAGIALSTKLGSIMFL